MSLLDKIVHCIASDSSGSCFETQLSLSPDGLLTTISELPSNIYEVFIKLEDTSYRLGTFNISSRKCLKETKELSFTYSVPVSESSTLRIHSLLKNANKLPMRINNTHADISAKTVDQNSLNATQFFICETEETFDANINTSVTCNFELLHLSFEFNSKIIYKNKNSLALSLPASAIRKFRRHTPRFHTNTTFSASTDNVSFTDISVKDISYTGMRFSIKNPFVKFERWQQIYLKTPNNKPTSHTIWKGLVIDISSDEYGVIFASTDGTKDLFYKISEINMPLNYSTTESPIDAWTCLENSGYTKLLPSKALESTKSECLNSWSKSQTNKDVLQPVIFHDKKPIGTIGSVKDRHDHWVPHSLGTQVDPVHLDVTAFLYYSWPIYQLMDSTPTWFSTYYDSQKKWHNRFYQAFVDEHEEKPGVITYTRHWLLCSETKTFETKTNISDFDQAPLNLQHECIRLWDERYGSLGNCPSLSRSTAKFNSFTHSFEIFHRDNEIIAISKSIKSNLQLNPLSIFNAMHINIFTPHDAENDDTISDIVRAAISHQAQNDISTSAISLDLTSSMANIAIPNLYYFCKAKCLSATSINIPALISNDVLCFEEMKCRQRKTT